MVKAIKTGKEWKALCPKHDDHHPSLSIYEEKGVYHCFGCGWKGKLFIETNPRTIVATYDYPDEENKLLYQVVKYNPKDFVVRRRDENHEWVYNLKGVKKVLYKLPDLLNAKKNKAVFIVEGEKDVDNLNKLCLIATTCQGGANGWTDDYCKYLQDRIIILLPDNDDDGRMFSIKVGNSLQGIAKKIKYLELPGLADKEDVSDWIVKGGDREKLIELAQKAPNFNEISIDADLIIGEKFNARDYSNYLLEKFNVRCDKFKRLWVYNSSSGLWQDNGEVSLDSILRKEILNKEQHIKDYYVQEIIKDVKGLTFTDEEISEPKPYLIPFNDKIYNLISGTFIDYSPEYFFVNKLPIKIGTDNCKCPTIDKIFEDMVGTENKVLLYELIGYCLLRDNPAQKIFMIYGGGSNGKTTFSEILEKLIGKDNISSVNLKDFKYNYRFSPGQLFGKLANFSGEIEEDFIKDTSVIKQLTGNDLIKCERKFKEPFLFRNYAKMFVFTNNIPSSSDKTKAFYRRVLLIKFPNEFEKGKNMIERIVDTIPDEEFEGLAKKCVNTLKDLKAKNFIFNGEDSIEKVTREYERLSNPLSNFIKEHTVDDPNTSIAIADFKEKFHSYQRSEKMSAWSARRINNYMKEEGYAYMTATTQNENGKDIQYRAWSGIKWKELTALTTITENYN